MLSDSLGRVEDTENVGVVDVTEVVGGEFDGGLDDGNTGVGKETSDGAKLLVGLLDGLLDEIGISDIALVGLDLDAKLLGNLLGSFLCLGVRAVEDGDVGTSVGDSLAHGETCDLYSMVVAMRAT